MLQNLIISKIVALLGSDRMWALVSGVLVMVFRDYIGLDAETTTKITTMIVTWIAGQSVRPSHGDNSGNMFRRQK